MDKTKPTWNKKVINLGIYLGYGEKGLELKAKIKADAKAAKKPLYRYILEKLGY